MGPWMLTRQGLELDLLDPQPEQINLVDITHGLHQRRYSGQANITIWQHSLLVAAIIPMHVPEGESELIYGVAALLHDAHEAYLGDTPSPVERAIAALMQDDQAANEYAGYFTEAMRGLEERVDRAILAKLATDYGADLSPLLTEEVRAAVRAADLDALLVEREVLLGVRLHDTKRRSWGDSVEARATEVDQAPLDEVRAFYNGHEHLKRVMEETQPMVWTITLLDLIARL